MEKETFDLTRELDAVSSPFLSQEEWQRVDEILDAALEIPDVDRLSYLENACADSLRVRRQVDVLLAACQGAAESTFLKPLSGGVESGMIRAMAADIPVEQLRAGQQVGYYRIVKPVGRGGMGVVYLAERSYGQFKKQVALKVVKRGMDTADILHRFKFERQLLARLEHANIARMLDGGVTNDGLPYFVMEYVQGETIDRYCDSRKLSVRERLKLFKTVCEAVQYAHRNLVVHRDLKPGNIMVTAEGEVKLLDFGIAKMLDAEAPMGTLPMTEASSRRMTPEYAAPEQVRGEAVTTATDVYALGVILYELLTGRRPYRFATRLFTEIEEKICQKVPGRPSTMAVRTLNDARFNVQEVSDRRSTQPARLRKVLTGDLDAITLKALKKEPELRYASAGDLGEDVDRYMDLRPVRAQRDSIRYRTGKFMKRYKLIVAAASFALLALVVGAVTTVWGAREVKIANEKLELEKKVLEGINTLTTGMIRSIDPNFLDDYELARLMMAGGLKDLNLLDEGPLVKARVMNASGEFARDFGMYDLADSLHQGAWDLQTEAGLDEDSPDFVESLNGAGLVLLKKREFDRAEAVFKESIQVNPTVVESYNNLGGLHIYQGRYDDAVEQYMKVLELDPDNVKATNNLGIVYYYTQKWDQALSWYERALSLEPSYQIYVNLGVLYYYHEGRFTDAARMYEEALELNDKDYAVWGNLANAYYRIPGAKSETDSAFVTAIRKAEKRLSEMNFEDTEVLSQLAMYHALMGNAEKSKSHLNRALELAPDANRVMMAAAYVYELSGEYDLSLHWLSKSIKAGYPLTNIEREPGFARLRTDPRYQAFTKALSNNSN